MTDDINAPDGNHEFTTDSCPSEQAFESANRHQRHRQGSGRICPMNHDDSDNERLADTFEQYRDDETTDHNPTAFGRTGTGKTERIARHARHRADDADTVESIALKGRGEENGG